MSEANLIIERQKQGEDGTSYVDLKEKNWDEKLRSWVIKNKIKTWRQPFEETTNL